MQEFQNTFKYLYAYTYILIYIHAYIHTHIYLYLYIYVYIYICKYTYICADAYLIERHKNHFVNFSGDRNEQGRFCHKFGDVHAKYKQVNFTYKKRLNIRYSGMQKKTILKFWFMCFSVNYRRRYISSVN